MKKVLVVATSKKTRGGITAVLRLYEQSPMWQQYHCRWIETHVDRSMLAKLWILVCGLAQYLIRLPGADIVHIHLSEPVSAKRKIPFFLLAKLLGKKTVAHFHSFSPDTTINGPKSHLYEFLFSHADAVIVLSNYWKDEVNKKYHLGDKVRVIYNPCPFPDTSNLYKKTNSIVYAGTLNKRKGYSDLIRAFAKIATNHPDWKVVFAGNGEEGQARALAEQMGMGNQIELLGWVNGQAKHEAFSKAKVFCLPSYAEGFPMAVLDAWAYGLPVVSTPVGGIPDVAVDGENMLLFNPGDIDVLAAKLEMIINDESLRDKLSASSLKMAANQFNLNTITNQVAEIYESIC